MAFYTPPMTILLVRHGETALNAARVMQPAATPLSDRGLAQAQAVAERLAPLRLAGVISSDLPRALQTAQAIAAAAGGLPVQTTPLLHERNFGDFRGRPHASFGFDPIEMLDAPPGGESMADFMARVAEARAWVLQAFARSGGPLAVVSHGLVIRAWLGPDAPRIGNTAVSLLAPKPPHAATLVNCTVHLDGRTAEDGSSLSGG
jgi:broad specificity phosphatase PhoE